MADLRKEELVKAYDEMLKQRHEDFKANLSSEECELIDILEYRRLNNTKYYKDLEDGLKDGTYAKPSEFIKEKLDWIFGGYIYERHKDALIYAVDNSINCAYSNTYHKRSFRMKDYIASNVFDIYV